MLVVAGSWQWCRLCCLAHGSSRMGGGRGQARRDGDVAVVAKSVQLIVAWALVPVYMPPL